MGAEMNRRKHWRARLASDEGSATAEYAIATMAMVARLEQT